MLREIEERKQAGPLRDLVRKGLSLDESPRREGMSLEESRLRQVEVMNRKREQKEAEKEAKKQRDAQNISNAPNNVKALIDELNKIAMKES
jgi:rRNA maturation endonuclease Nob1